jgi:hypothetical protein
MSATPVRHCAQRPPKGVHLSLRKFPGPRPIALRGSLAIMLNRASTLLRTTSLPSGNPVGASGVGIPDRPMHRDHASKIALGYTVSRSMADSAIFGLSPWRASPISWPSSTERSLEFCTQLLTWPLPLSGFFLPGPDTAICSFGRFCPAASCDSGSGTSLRLTIP